MCWFSFSPERRWEDPGGLEFASYSFSEPNCGVFCAKLDRSCKSTRSLCLNGCQGLVSSNEQRWEHAALPGVSAQTKYSWFLCPSLLATAMVYRWYKVSPPLPFKALAKGKMVLRSTWFRRPWRAAGAGYVCIILSCWEMISTISSKQPFICSIPHMVYF